MWANGILLLLLLVLLLLLRGVRSHFSCQRFNDLAVGETHQRTLNMISNSATDTVLLDGRGNELSRTARTVLDSHLVLSFVHDLCKEASSAIASNMCQAS